MRKRFPRVIFPPLQFCAELEALLALDSDGLIAA